MEIYLDKIKKAYDLTVEQYQDNINPIDLLPDDFKNSLKFKLFQSKISSEFTGSNNPEIKNYLLPDRNQKLLDVGCCANVANYRFDKWESEYFGIDISPKLINEMTGFVKHNNLNIGGLCISQADSLPFESNYFDLAMAIGVFEYYPLDYIYKGLTELNRSLKPNAKLVLDFPNKVHDLIEVMVETETFLLRPIIVYDIKEYDNLVNEFFDIIKVDKESIMIKYFLENKK